MVVAGANRHDMRLTEVTLEGIVIERPEPSEEEPQNLCLDAGYDYDPVRDVVAAWGYTAHIVPRDKEKRNKAKVPGYRARRWVVERTISWMNRYRRILIRWEKKTENYLGLVHLSCAFITYRAAGLFG